MEVIALIPFTGLMSRERFKKLEDDFGLEVQRMEKKFNLEISYSTHIKTIDSKIELGTMSTSFDVRQSLIEILSKLVRES